jgi:hypothetical protein
VTESGEFSFHLLVDIGHRGVERVGLAQVQRLQEAMTFGDAFLQACIDPTR